MLPFLIGATFFIIAFSLGVSFAFAVISGGNSGSKSELEQYEDIDS